MKTVSKNVSREQKRGYMQNDCIIIGVVGGSSKPSKWITDLAVAIGREVVAQGQVLLTGGKPPHNTTSKTGWRTREAAMMGASLGAKESLNDKPYVARRIGILPSNKNSQVLCEDKTSNEAGTCSDVYVHTGLGDARNYVNAYVSHVLIALDGGPGTASEITLALVEKRPVICVGAWKELEQKFKEGGMIFYVSTNGDVEGGRNEEIAIKDIAVTAVKTAIEKVKDKTVRSLPSALFDSKTVQNFDALMRKL